MTTLTVGQGKEYATIEAAVKASHSGDTVDVSAGTYKNDFLSINHSLTIEAVGGTVNLVATRAAPNGLALIDVGGASTVTTIRGFDISGAQGNSGTVAAIRYEGGQFTLDESVVHGNQQGFYGVADKNGIVTIENSTFSGNGNGGTNTSNLYSGNVSQIIIENSTLTAANSGSNIVSRAAMTEVEQSIVTDGATGTARYQIDLPNGGNATISGDIIEKGPHGVGTSAISFGEAGKVYGSSSLGVQDSTIVNDAATKGSIAIVNDSTVRATIDQNKFHGWASRSNGPAFSFLNSTTKTEPALTSTSAGDQYHAHQSGTATTSNTSSLFTTAVTPELAGLSSPATPTQHAASITPMPGGSATSLIASMNQHNAMQLIDRG